MTSVRKGFLLVGLWSLLGALFATQAFVGSHYTVRPLNWGQAFGVAFVAWYVRGAFAIPAVWLARRFPFTRKSAATALAVHLPASLLLAAIEQSVFAAAVTRISVMRGVTPSPVEFQINLVVYWIVVGAAHAAGYYAKVHETQMLAARLQSQLATARLDVLRGQLQPHFLFNTLNDIAELIHEDPDRADGMLMTLSDLLRSSLLQTERDVPLRQELDLLGRYLDISRMRFRDRLSINVEVSPALDGVLVPAFILQPIVENAIRHGAARRDGDGHVWITATRAGELLRLDVQDNGPGLSTASNPEGVGLRTTRQRLSEQFGSSAHFELTDRDGGGAVARIEIPAR